MIHPRHRHAAACDGVVDVQLAQLQGNSHATASRCSNRIPPVTVSLHQTSRFLEDLHVNKSTMSSPAAATVPPQLSRDDARAMCAPANNLNAGFLQFETAHEGLGGGHLRPCLSDPNIIHLIAAQRPEPLPQYPHTSPQPMRIFAPFPAMNQTNSWCAISCASSDACSRSRRSWRLRCQGAPPWRMQFIERVL